MQFAVRAKLVYFSYNKWLDFSEMY